MNITNIPTAKGWLGPHYQLYKRRRIPGNAWDSNPDLTQPKEAYAKSPNKSQENQTGESLDYE